MTDAAPIQAVVAAFRTPDGASKALEELKSIGGDVLAVKEAAVLVRDAEAISRSRSRTTSPRAPW